MYNFTCWTASFYSRNIDVFLHTSIRLAHVAFLNWFLITFCSLWFICLFNFHLDTLPAHGRANFRDERSSKTYERLQKKLKDRHGTQKDKLNSPPSSPQKCPSPTSEPNGLTKGQDTAGISTGSTKSKSVGKGKSNSQTDVEIEGKC